MSTIPAWLDNLYKKMQFDCISQVEEGIQNI